MNMKITSYKNNSTSSELTHYDASFDYTHSLGSAQIESLSTTSNEFNDIFFIPKNHNTGILPPGVIALDNNVVIYECTPTTKLVEYTECVRDSINSDTVYNTASIPVPWQVYVVIFNNNYEVVETYMYYSKSSIIKNGYDQPVYLPALINFYSNGHLCRPFYASTTDTDFYSKDVAGVISASYDAVWSSGWNADLIDCLLNYNYDIRFSFYPETALFKQYIDNKYSPGKYASIVNSSSMNYINRDKSFSNFVKSIENHDIEDALNWCYAVPSFEVIRDHEISSICEHASEDYNSNVNCDEEDCCQGEEDDCSYHNDVSNYIEEKKNEFWTIPRTFSDVLENILRVQSNNLDFFDPVPRFYTSLFKIFSNKVIKYSNSSYSVEEEPF